MKSFAQSLALFLPLLTADLSASSQQRSTWINQEITDPARVPIQKVDEFINQTCQPSNLDGIQILGVQNGHDDSIKLHVYCRQDNAASAHYIVTTVRIPNRKVDETVVPILKSPKVRIGPFYFGQNGAEDAFLLIEKTR